MSDDDLCEVIVTAPDPEWLAGFARRLVDDGLAAAAHLHPIRSLYRWQGEAYDESESRVALHTRRALVPVLLDRVQREHPFEVPGFFVLPLLAGSPAYDDWVRAGTSAAGRPGPAA